MLKKIHIWLTVALTAMLSLAGCSDDDMPYETPANSEEQLGGNVFIRFHISINNDSRSRDTHDNTLTPGTSQEDYINNIDLLVEDADTKKLIDIVPISRDQLTMVEGHSDTYSVTVPILAQKGQKLHIYAAVNMPYKIRSKFKIKGNLFDHNSYHYEGGSGRSTSMGDYWDMMNELIPGCAGMALQSGSQAAIPMTGQFGISDPNTSGLNYEIKIPMATGSPSDAPMTVTANVSRIVAKVHVLVKTAPHSETGTAYALAKAVGNIVGSEEPTPTPSNPDDYDPKKDYGYIGWIQLNNIRYMPNGLPKSTYLFPQFYSGSPQDLTMDIDVPVINDQFDSNNWGLHYIYYNGTALHKENVLATHHLATAEEYSTTNSGSRYTNGMYCFENYFDKPENAEMYDQYDNSIPMVTHVSIAAKLVPRNIVFRTKFVHLMDGFVNEYNTDPVKFRQTYSLTVDDFTDADVKHWNKVIRPKYFAKYDTSTTPSKGGGTTPSEGSETGGGTPTGDSGNPQTVAESSETPDEHILIESFHEGHYYIIRTESEEDAITILNYSLKASKLWTNETDPEKTNSRYPSGTFFVYDTNYDDKNDHDAQWTQRYLYMAPGAVDESPGGHWKFKAFSVPHYGGWGYYYTYLNETNVTSATGKIPYMASQVTRNHYYIITVDNFGVPGGSISRPEHIRANTQSVDWVYGGKSDINLR